MDIKKYFTNIICYICYLTLSVSSEQSITGDVVGMQRNETSAQATFREVYEDTLLEVTPIAILKDMGYVQCSLSCLSEPKCLAYNIWIAQRKCQLLDVDRNMLFGPLAFVPKPGWSYYDTGLTKFNIRQKSWRTKPLVSTTFHCHLQYLKNKSNKSCILWDVCYA